MKNISLILNVVLIVAVGVLYVLHFSGGGASTGKGSTTVVDSTGRTLKVAYVNMDSLFEKYAFYGDLTELMEQKKQSSEATLNAKAASLERQAMEFQEKLQKHLITQRQAEEMGQKLEKDRQQILQLQADLTQRLVEDERLLNKQLYDSISSFLKDYNAEHNYNLVLSVALGTNLLYGDSTLDITADVIKGLNTRYGVKEGEDAGNEEKKNEEGKKEN